MTIITKPLSQQEKDKKDEDGEKTMEEVSLKSEGNDVEAATVISPAKRKANSSNMCLVVTVMLATCLGLTVLGYYQLHQRHQTALYRRGTCRLPCHMRRQQQQQQLCRRRASLRSGPPKDVLFGQPPRDGAALVLGDLGYWQSETEEQPLIRTDIEVDASSETETDTFNDDGTFELRWEMDLEQETFELIQMPDISSGVYVHDFTVNRTAIIEDNRCFVMVMDRNEIAPPRNLFDLLMKTTKDGYQMDLDEIQHDMMIVLPELTNDDVLKQYGWFIGKACRGKIAYKLEPVPEEIALLQDIDASIEDEEDTVKTEDIVRTKRSTKHAKKFQEISKSLISYNIVNYDAAEA